MVRNAATLNELIEEVYDAALDPVGWSMALRKCCSYLAGASFQIYAIDTQSLDCLFQIEHGLPKEFTQEYVEYFSKKSNRNHFHLSHPEIDVGYDYLMMDEHQLERDKCTHWRSKFGLRYYLGGPILKSDNALFLAALQRSAKQGHPSKNDIEAYRRLRGHLAQALRIHKRLDNLELRHRSAWEAVESASVGVIVLDNSGAVLESNRLASRILALADGLVSDGCELGARRPVDDQALKRVIGSAIGGVGGGGNLAIARRGRERPYSLVVCSVRERSEFSLPAVGRVLILINDPDREADIPADLLQSHYGLTKKQVEIATLLARGLKVSECAEKLGIADKTARRHLATIFTKTDLHRQADLIRLVLSLPSLRQ